MKKLIIQTSPPHTASTLLINALYGLIPELNDKKIIDICADNLEKYFNDIIVIKNHNINIDELIEKYKDQYDLYFVCSERKNMNKFIDDKYKSYNNVCVFDFNELNETPENTIPQIIQNIYDKINSMLNIELNVEGGINRINLMNVRYEEIKEKPFSYVEDFFKIHGSHRNRIENCKIEPENCRTENTNIIPQNKRINDIKNRFNYRNPSIATRRGIYNIPSTNRVYNLSQNRFTRRISRPLPIQNRYQSLNRTYRVNPPRNVGMKVRPAYKVFNTTIRQKPIRNVGLSRPYFRPSRQTYRTSRFQSSRPSLRYPRFNATRRFGGSKYLYR
jgi:hypothetical protein